MISRSRSQTGSSDVDRFVALIESDDRSDDEKHRLAQLMSLLYELPEPPDPYGLYPDYGELKERFCRAAEGSDSDRLEETFLALYCHVHGYEVPYTEQERDRVTAMAGYLCHPGGLSPILKAEPFVSDATVSGDFGAGNGLQGLLLQYLFPHKKTVQIEISSRMVDAGRQLQQWIGVDEGRVEWLAADISEVSPEDMDFVYLYRPVRPDGGGRQFYESFSKNLERCKGSIVIFSVADCLGSFLSPKFETFYCDGHLTCFRRRG